MFDTVDLEYPSSEGAWIERTAKDDKRIILPRTGPSLAKRVQQVDSSVPPVSGGCSCPAINVRRNSYTTFVAAHSHLGRD